MGKKEEKIKNYFRSILKDDYDKFDLNAYIDKSLTYEENLANIHNAIIGYSDFNERKTAQDFKSEQEKDEVDLFKEVKREETQAIREFNESLKNFTGGSLEKFNELKRLVKVVVNTDIHGLIVEGEAGIGKSFNILQALKESGKAFVYSNGFTTTLELYHFLFENRDKIIFFDDDDVFRNKTMLSLLKATLYSATGTRLVSYKSTSNKLKVPSQFIFKGKVITALNQIDKSDHDMKAVIDRGNYYNMEFSYLEKLEILRSIAELEYKQLTKQDRLDVFEYLRKNTSQATKNLNIRLLLKLFEVYIYDKSEFGLIAKGMIDNDKEVQLIIQVLEESNSIREAEVEWCKATGKSRRTFFNKKKGVKVGKLVSAKVQKCN